MTEALRAQIQAIYQAARQEAAEAETPQERRAVYQRAMQQIQDLIGERERPAGNQVQDRDRDRDRISQDNPDRPAQDRSRLRDPKARNIAEQRRDRDCDADTGDDTGDEEGDEATALLSGTAGLLDTLDLTPEQQQALAEVRLQARIQLRNRIRALLTEEQQAQLRAAHEQAGQMEGMLGPKGEQLQNRMKVRIWQALELTEEQQQFIRETMEAARAAMQEATTPEERRAIMEAAREAILGILTEEQLAKLEEIMNLLPDPQRHRLGGPGLPGMLACLDLTPEQVEFIQQTLADARAAAAAAEKPEEKRQIMQDAHELILTVLTDEQLEQLQGLMGDGRPDRPRLQLPAQLDCLELTEEQLAAIAAIREAARTAAEGADTPEARRAIMEQAHQAILDVLTEEQLALLEQIQSRLRLIGNRGDDSGSDSSGDGSANDPADQGGQPGDRRP